MSLKVARKLFLLSFFLLLPLDFSFADDGRVWKFDTKEDISGWIGQGAAFDFMEGEGLVRIGPGAAERVFISPAELGISADKAYFLKIRMRALDGSGGTGFVLFMPSGAKGFLNAPFLRFEIKPDAGFRDYTFNFKGFFWPQTAIERFLVGFTGESSFEVDYISIYSPSLMESLWFDLKDAMQGEERIGGTTINFVITPRFGAMPLPVVLYLLGIIITLAIFLLARKFTMDGLARAVIISFISIGFIFALRMDYNWFRIFKKDLKAFSKKNVEEIIAMTEGNDLYRFISIAKTLIPEGKKARRFPDTIGTAADYYPYKGKYYLLPVRMSTDGEYVVVYRDDTFAFDPLTRSLSKDGVKVASRVELIYNHNNYGFIYRVVSEGSK